jgi:hypothetical protein
MLHTQLVQTHEGMLKTNAPSFDACKVTRWSLAFGHRTTMCIKTDVSEKPALFFLTAK